MDSQSEDVNDSVCDFILKIFIYKFGVDVKSLFFRFRHSHQKMHIVNNY